jgi:hypothetical protein
MSAPGTPHDATWLETCAILACWVAGLLALVFLVRLAGGLGP